MKSASTRTKKPFPTPSAEDEPTESLSETVYHRLLRAIITGDYPHDSVLSELGLARELGVSRTPVHDALRQLVKDGLLTRERNCRARVAGMTADDVFEVFEMRKFLEPPAAELAAGRMDLRQLTPLKSAAAELRTKSKGPAWVEKWAEFDDLFHQTIAEASGNRRLAADIGRYRLLHKSFNRIATDSHGLQKALAEHVEILAALEARDGGLARERMLDHIGAWQEHFIRSMPMPPRGEKR